MVAATLGRTCGPGHSSSGPSVAFLTFSLGVRRSAEARGAHTRAFFLLATNEQEQLLQSRKVAGQHSVEARQERLLEGKGRLPQRQRHPCRNTFPTNT